MNKISPRLLLATFFFLAVSIPLRAQPLDGTWAWISDDAGASPKGDASVTLRLFAGGAEVSAIQPGQTVREVGSWKATGGKLDLEIPTMGIKVTKGAYTLAGNDLTMPFRMVNEGAGTSRWKKLSRSVIGTAEQTACPLYGDNGLAVTLCSGTMGQGSVGTDCLYMVTRQDNVVVQRIYRCTVSCPEGLNIDLPCDKEALRKFVGKPTWRSYDALDPAVRGKLDKLYTDLLAMVRAHGTPKYKQLGGDSIRTDLKGKIITMIGEEMLPFIWSAIPERNDLKFIYPQEYAEAAAVAAQGTSPMGIQAIYSWFRVFESAFYHKDDKTGAITRVDPNETAAELIHESYHWRQYNWGAGTGRMDAVGSAMMLLNEIQAYSAASTHGLYLYALTPDQYRALAVVGAEAQIKELKTSWKTMSKGERKDLALWAFGKEYNQWMHARMMAAPTEDGGVWGMLMAEIGE